MIQRDVHAACDESFPTFRGRPHVHCERGCALELLGGPRRAETIGGLDEIGAISDAGEPALEIARDVVEADSAKANGRLLLATRIRDDDDRTRVVQQRASPGCILTTETDIEAAGEVHRRKLGRLPPA